MTEIRLSILTAATALVLGAAPRIAQVPAPSAPVVPQAQPVLPKPQPNFYRNLIVIDPAHGGSDRGAQLTNGASEKDVTLAFAQRLRPALVAQGFTVVSTRDSDPADSLLNDQRAGIANHNRPLACLLLHATESGAGIHLATSSLEPTENTPRVQRWSNAQSSSIAMSQRLANEVGLALMDAHLPVVLLRASVPPVDNLTCAATVVEISPFKPENGNKSQVTDSRYQQRIADAIAQGLASFRTRNAPAPASIPSTPAVPARAQPSEAPLKSAPAPAKPQTVPAKPLGPAASMAKPRPHALAGKRGAR
ncbi:MAG: N-acetylmuramoyl-L-alanine amidase [Edaphobacter sp.]|uniref:N-acetylmuramoyl-L-alanine amidase family protein n=1 Tax=Edaphobacter sp. TaxID=1934404 RepID=UPI00238EBCC7|nr:N-acetylmuramoyl-L-alanine amidase [Edaphobacter sp.]MDE1176056.1 N-acetylmuramoyl-L-alanine amidase [Edaphobacter sp.]